LNNRLQRHRHFERSDHPDGAGGGHLPCLRGRYAPDGGSASYTLASWVVGSSDVGGKLKVSLPSSVFVGGTASAVASWSGLTPDQRYMGAVQFLMNGTAPLSTMPMEVDATNPVPVPGPPPGTGLAAETTKTLCPPGRRRKWQRRAC
jgi:hypothetical protein